MGIFQNRLPQCGLGGIDDFICDIWMRQTLLGGARMQRVVHGMDTATSIRTDIDDFVRGNVPVEVFCIDNTSSLIV